METEKHNKFVSVERGDLKNVIEVGIEDQETFEKDEHEIKRKLNVSTTQGGYDPDYLKWKAYIVSCGGDDEALVLVKEDWSATDGMIKPEGVCKRCGADYGEDADFGDGVCRACVEEV